MNLYDANQSDIVATVRVVDADVDGGFRTINESDLTADDELYVEGQEPKKRGRPAAK